MIIGRGILGALPSQICYAVLEKNSILEKTKFLAELDESQTNTLNWFIIHIKAILNYKESIYPNILF